MLLNQKNDSIDREWDFITCVNSNGPLEPINESDQEEVFLKKRARFDESNPYSISPTNLIKIHACFHGESYEFLQGKNKKIKNINMIEKLQNQQASCSSDGTETTRSMSWCSMSSSLSEAFCFIRVQACTPQIKIHPIELFEGAILGRTVVSRVSGGKRTARNTRDMKRVDLGIGYNDSDGRYVDGISRDQVEIINMTETGVLIKVCDNVRNPIAVKSGTYQRQYGAGQIRSLQEGDIIIFDSFMKRPKHSFKLKKFI